MADPLLKVGIWTQRQAGKEDYGKTRRTHGKGKMEIMHLLVKKHQDQQENIRSHKEG